MVQRVERATGPVGARRNALLDDVSGVVVGGRSHQPGRGIMRTFRLLVVAAALATTGCYHAVIDTGRPASGTTITKPWAHSFLYGLVPPEIVQTASQCPNGLAKVETQHSFLNSVAAAITFGIYTPIQIDVQCASSGGDRDAVLDRPVGTDPRVFLAHAAQVSMDLQTPVYVRLSKP